MHIFIKNRCILYEIIVGIPPFNDETVEKIFDNACNLKIEWPEIGKCFT
jgi:hypothetical protein